MNCSSCGAELKEGAKYCAKCGTSTNQTFPATQKTSSKMRNIPFGVIFAGILIVVVLNLLFGGRSYKTTIKQYIDATMEGDAKKIVSLMPEEYVEEAIRSGEYENKRELINELDDALKSMTELFEESFGKRMRYSHEINSVYTYTKDEMDMYLYHFDYGNISDKVKEIKEIEYSLNISGSGNSGNTSETLLLYKIGRNWYISSPIIN